MPAPPVGYIKLGDIKGNSEDENHVEWIEMMSINHGANRNINPTSNPAEAMSNSQVHMGAIDITKKGDQSSPELISRVASGLKIPEVIIDLVRTTSEGREVYYQWTLEDAYIINYGIHGGSAGDKISVLENVSICYSTIKWTFLGKTAGQEEQGAVEHRWDMRTNKLA